MKLYKGDGVTNSRVVIILYDAPRNYLPLSVITTFYLQDYKDLLVPSFVKAGRADPTLSSILDRVDSYKHSVNLLSKNTGIDHTHISQLKPHFTLDPKLLTRFPWLTDLFSMCQRSYQLARMPVIINHIDPFKNRIPVRCVLAPRHIPLDLFKQKRRRSP